MLNTLERNYHQFSERSYDRILSFRILHILVGLLTPEETMGFVDLIENFLSLNYDKISQIYEEYRDDTNIELLFQPETILIFERLKRHKSSLTAAWDLPISLLEQLSLIWGEPIIVEY